MKAAYYDRYGDAKSVLEVKELPDPQPSLGQVRVRLSAAGVNPSDTKGRRGISGAPMPYPRIVPGQDGAGTIDCVGDGVPPARIGERVWVYEAQIGRPMGTAATLVVVPAVNAVRLPDDVSFDVGACLGVPALTAHRSLFTDGSIKDQRVLVTGGAGAVGCAAILLAKWAGAWVATTVSRPEQEDVVRSLGADLVINRRTEDIAAIVRAATDNRGVDRIVDVDLTANFAVDTKCIAPNGVISAYASDTPTAVLSIPFRPTMMTGVTIRFIFVYGMPDAARQQAIRDVTDCLATGAYHPRIAQHFPLGQIAQAHDLQDSGNAVGKILLKLV